MLDVGDVQAKDIAPNSWTSSRIIVRTMTTTSRRTTTIGETPLGWHRSLKFGLGRTVGSAAAINEIDASGRHVPQPFPSKRRGSRTRRAMSGS